MNFTLAIEPPRRQEEAEGMDLFILGILGVLAVQYFEHKRLPECGRSRAENLR